MLNQPLKKFHLNGFCLKQVNPLTISKEAFDPILNLIACKVLKLRCFKVLAYFSARWRNFRFFGVKVWLTPHLKEHKKLYLSDTKKSPLHFFMSVYFQNSSANFDR